MKIIFLMISSFFVLQAHGSSLLEESLETTNRCLAELESHKKMIEMASGYSNEKVASILDSIEMYKIENKHLYELNSNLKKKIIAISKDNKQIKTELSLAKKKILALKSGVSKKTEKKDASSKIQVIEDAFISSISFVKKYKIPLYMMNIRKGPSTKFKIVAVAKKDEIFPYSEIHTKNYKDKQLLWIKTEEGWLYVPSSKRAEEIIAYNSLELRSKKLASLRLQKGGL